MTAKSGIAPFSIPVVADETCCSAIGNMLSGNAIQRTARAKTPRQSPRESGVRAPRTLVRTAKPTRSRMNVTPLGPMAVRPSAMNRNEAPQIRPGTTTSAASPTVVDVAEEEEETDTACGEDMLQPAAPDSLGQVI